MNAADVYRAKLLPGLLDDVGQGFDWYEAQAVGVGHEFIRAFYAAVAEATRQPLLAREIYAGFRRARLRRFPYSLFYRVEADTVTFSLLFHGAREPKSLPKILLSRRDDTIDPL